MTNVDEPLADFLPVADVRPPMSSSGISNTTISTDHLGPCIGFLLHLRRNNEELSFLNHYSFDNDESDLPIGNILLEILNHICQGLKTALDIPSLAQDPEISFIHLLVAGGAKSEADAIKSTLATLNSFPFDIQALVMHPDDFYLYMQLLNNVTIVESVSMMLENEEEDELGEEKDKEGHDFPSVWLYYSCQTKNVTMGINWSFKEDKYNLGILQFNLGASNLCECKWNLDNEKIKRSKDSYHGDLALRFEEVLSLIPENAFMTSSSRLDINDADTVTSSITSEVKSLDVEKKTMSDIETKPEQVNENEDEIDSDDDEDVLDENDEENSKTTGDDLPHVGKSLKRDTISTEMGSSSDDDLYKETFESITTCPNTQSTTSKQVKIGHDNKKARKEEMQAIKSEVMSSPITSLNPSETITEDKVRDLVSQKEYMTFTELIQNFLPKTENLQTKEIKDNIIQTLTTILKRLNIEKKIINEETWIKLN